jgi:signal transduction histidine kinase
MALVGWLIADKVRTMAMKAAETACSSLPGPKLELCPRPRVDSRERMPALVAHDLFGIVTIIKGYAELVPTAPSKELQQDYCLRILRACDRMVDMVDRSVELSKQESGLLVMKKRKVELAPFLADCLAAQTIKAQNKGMVLSLEIGAELSTASIDPGCVERVLSNLLENAIKFSHPTSTIKLTARVLADAVEIEVQDDGQGIPEAELATLFDAYQTGSARPTGGERSTGLGLAIVKELVLAHHGTIDVRSEVGHGTTFSVRLPLDGPGLSATYHGVDRRRASPQWTPNVLV